MTGNIKTLIYIASDERSGSTLLDHIIGNHDDIICVGELMFFNDYLNQKGIGSTSKWVCRCGMTLECCPFWSNVIESCRLKENHEISDLETIIYKRRNTTYKDAFLTLLISYLPTKWKKPLLKKILKINENKNAAYNCYKLLDHVCSVENKKIVIDSSKYPSQLSGLINYKRSDYNIKVIHLIRDGRSVAISKIKRKKELFGENLTFTRALLGWLLINLKISNIKDLLPPQDYILVRYEDLCVKTEQTIAEICDHFDISYDSKILEFSEKKKHNIAGSQHKFDQSTRIQLDEKWKSSLSASRNFLYSMICYILANKVKAWKL